MGPIDFGGISGGPVLAVIETEKIRSWIPTGVIFQGPHTSHDPAKSIPGFDLIRARPVGPRFLLALVNGGRDAA